MKQFTIPIIGAFVASCASTEITYAADRILPSSLNLKLQKGDSIIPCKNIDGLVQTIGEATCIRVNPTRKKTTRRKTLNYLSKLSPPELNAVDGIKRDELRKTIPNSINVDDTMFLIPGTDKYECLSSILIYSSRIEDMLEHNEPLEMQFLFLSKC